MNIKDYITKKQISQTDFAKSIGITYQSLYRIIEKIHQPSLDTAVKIVEATGGKVTYHDLLLQDSSHKKQKNKSKTTKSKPKH